MLGDGDAAGQEQPHARIDLQCLVQEAEIARVDDDLLGVFLALGHEPLVEWTGADEAEVGGADGGFDLVHRLLHVVGRFAHEHCRLVLRRRLRWQRLPLEAAHVGDDIVDVAFLESLGDKRAHDRYAALLLIGIGASPEMFGGLLHGTSEELSSFDAYNRFVRRFSPDDTNAGTGKNQNEDSTQSSTSEGNNGDPGGSGVTPNTTLPSSSSIGATRVQKVVDHFGDEVVATQKIIKIPGVGSTDIDVELTGNRYIEVGGPAKGASKDALSKFGGQLRKISIYAQQQGGKAYFYYDAGTSQEAIDLAVRWFGEGSVFPLPK